MKYRFIALLASALCPGVAAPAFAACVPTLSSADNVSISFLAADSDEIHNREFAEISDDLATALGIAAGDVDADDEAPNPQIRVRVQSAPGTSGVASSNAIFTVVAIVTTPDTANRLWVHEQAAANDKESGEFKLLGINSTGGVYDALDTTPADGILDAVVARAFTVPVSSSAFTNSSGTTTTTTYYCEPSTSMSYLEKAAREADDRIVALAPHGGNIEAPTSSQANRFATKLESLNATPVNVWNLEGKWGGEQTFQRWHVTATSIDVASYPGLAGLLPGDGDFDRAVAFHGFKGTTSLTACSSGPAAGTPSYLYQIILGGGAERNLKCAIAQSIKAASTAIAIDIRDEAEGDMDVADACGRVVTITDYGGTHEDNIVNRLAAQGGIQLEQSKVLRDDLVLPNLVADAVAGGFADYAADDTTDYCSGL
jgi:phage replication-related protein YjqB (UPF0714/DUF867 family)